MLCSLWFGSDPTQPPDQWFDEVHVHWHTAFPQLWLILLANVAFVSGRPSIWGEKKSRMVEQE